MTSSSILYTFYFAIVAWLYSSIGVLFLSDSVPELYNMFMTKCMWFTLMSGISLMCSRTPSWRALQDCRLLYGLAKVLQRWYFRWRDDKRLRFIVSHRERFVFTLRHFKDDMKSLNKPLLQRTLCFSLCFLHSLNKGLTFFNTASQGRSGFKKPKRFVWHM